MVLSLSLSLSLVLSRSLFLQKHGLVILPEGTPNGDYHHEPHHAAGLTLVSQEAAQLLESAGDGPLGEWEEPTSSERGRRVETTQSAALNDGR